jgi:Flp pilus assembly protein TadG
MMSFRGSRRRTERGAAATEIVLLAPVVMLVIAVMVGGARVWFARAAVTDAAYASARAATLERSAGPARRAGEAAAAAALADVPCSSYTVALDTAGFAVPVGNPAQVRAQISCSVNLADLFGLTIPGTFLVEASSASALDTYRRRQ